VFKGPRIKFKDHMLKDVSGVDAEEAEVKQFESQN
jgi:hypothetical protein